MTDIIKQLEQQARWVVPEGYEVLATGTKIGVLLTRWTERACRKERDKIVDHLGNVPMVRYEIERVGRWKYELVAYQNVLSRREGVDVV